MPIWLYLVIGVVLAVIGGLLFWIGLLLDDSGREGGKAGIPGSILLFLGTTSIVISIIAASFTLDWGQVV